MRVYFGAPLMLEGEKNGKRPEFFRVFFSSGHVLERRAAETVGRACDLCFHLCVAIEHGGRGIEGGHRDPLAKLRKDYGQP